MVPADLVEATLISGALVLEDFDGGLDILLEAEEGAGLMISGKAYFALMRLASAEDRPLDVLALLARTRARGVERTDGLILGAMEAAESVEDWGAVRLRTHAECPAKNTIAACPRSSCVCEESAQRSFGISHSRHPPRTATRWRGCTRSSRVGPRPLRRRQPSSNRWATPRFSQTCARSEAPRCCRRQLRMS